MSAKNQESEIKSTGELRQFLVDMMINVKAGILAIDRAAIITKMAGQVNESFYSEIKVARVQKEAGIKAAALGALVIGEK